MFAALEALNVVQLIVPLSKEMVPKVCVIVEQVMEPVPVHDRTDAAPWDMAPQVRRTPFGIVMVPVLFTSAPLPLFQESTSVSEVEADPLLILIAEAVTTPFRVAVAPTQ